MSGGATSDEGSKSAPSELETATLPVGVGDARPAATADDRGSSLGGSEPAALLEPGRFDLNEARRERRESLVSERVWDIKVDAGAWEAESRVCGRLVSPPFLEGVLPILQRCVVGGASDGEWGRKGGGC